MKLTLRHRPYKTVNQLENMYLILSILFQYIEKTQTKKQYLKMTLNHLMGNVCRKSIFYIILIVGSLDPLLNSFCVKSWKIYICIIFPEMKVTKLPSKNSNYYYIAL